jgi:hypothetical protein
MNTTTQTVLKYTVIGGSVVMVAGAIGQLFTQPISVKGSIMPAISILVGVSAFSYAMSGEEIRIIPKG